MRQSMGGNSGSREPDPSFTGSGPSGFDPGRVETQLSELAEERQRVRDRLSHCTDLFGQMLLMGKLKALHREADELRTECRL